MRVLAIDEEATALGASLGGTDGLDDTVGKVLTKICDNRIAIASIWHAATQMVLTMMCADVGTLVSRLRRIGDGISSNLLAQHEVAL